MRGGSRACRTVILVLWALWALVPVLSVLGSATAIPSARSLELVDLLRCRPLTWCAGGPVSRSMSRALPTLALCSDRRLNERKARLFAEEPPLSERQRGEEPSEPPYGFEDGSETKAEVERRLPMTLEAAAALYEG